MKNGFFDSISGNKSSSRLIGFIVIIYAMLMGFLVLFWGKEGSEGMIALATASGVLFTTISGPVFVWLYNQKKTEIKQEKP
jgi:vacuolar-type H+-ATPase subunit I/STV1